MNFKVLQSSNYNNNVLVFSFKAILCIIKLFFVCVCFVCVKFFVDIFWFVVVVFLGVGHFNLLLFFYLFFLGGGGVGGGSSAGNGEVVYNFKTTCGKQACG